MKTQLPSLRTIQIDLSHLKIREMTYQLHYIARKYKVDFDVYLESYGCNLQRDYVWTLEQKQEIVLSILKGRHIPHIAVINTINDELLIIDGKQRLSSLFDFYSNKFPIIINDIEYYFNDLPNDYQREISHYRFKAYELLEETNPTSDDDKIKWFTFLNFAGTKQDDNHLNKLNKLKNTDY